VIYSPGAWSASGHTLRKRWWPPPEESRRHEPDANIYDGLPLPAFLMPKALSGTALEVRGRLKNLWRHPRRDQRQAFNRRREIHALMAERAGQDHPVQSDIRLYPTDGEPSASMARRCECVVRPHLPPRTGALVSNHQPVQGAVDLRGTCGFRCRRSATCASTSGRDIDSYPEVHAETAELIKFLGL